jgi:N-acetylglutamate synthase-like GNAT family acetyltransferase
MAGCSEGIRAANITDLAAIDSLLQPLAVEGVTKPRTREQIRASLASYTVVEREGKVGQSPSTVSAR